MKSKIKKSDLSYHSIRSVNSPDDLANNRKIYSGVCSIKNILDLPTDQNVRDYLLAAEGKKRKRPSQVHKAIQDTLENNPDSFSVLNGGITIVANKADIDEKTKTVALINGSIINGAQTQGVIRDFFETYQSRKSDPDYNPFIKFELIVTEDNDLIAEISIARNFQNDVMTISIAGRLGHLDDLEKAFQTKNPNSKLQKSETKLSEDYIKTERLLQVITALIPNQLWPKSSELNKVISYNMKSKCLKLFQEIYQGAHNREDKHFAEYRDLYQFYLDIAAEAYELYNTWKTHKGFKGTGLRSIERDEQGDILNVPDGIVFPILAAYSEFVESTESGWTIKPPSRFTEADFINAAKSAYMNIAYSNPQTMGKSKACYSSLAQVAQIFKRLD